MESYFAGIDAGACTTKAVIIDNHIRIVGHNTVRSGIDFERAASTALAHALEMAGIKQENISAITATGYGRYNLPLAFQAKTEIACQAKGCFFLFPCKITIVDIGGQDSKIIKLDERGGRISFKMNRKCAAGTGAFLEETSNRLGISIDQMDALARRATKNIELGSYCTVFTSTEILEKIRMGIAVENIARAIFRSVINRILEMTTLEGDIVLTGGVVAHNPYLVEMIEKEIGGKVLVPPKPQLTGALGAAIFAAEGSSRCKSVHPDE